LASDYDQLLFGLSLIAPLPYYEPNNGQGNVVLQTDWMKKRQKTLKSYKFRVEVDNLRLARPILLPSVKEGIISEDCVLRASKPHEFELRDGEYKEPVTINKVPIKVKTKDKQYAVYNVTYSNPQVGGRPLRFSGYMFNQTGRLYPREIQGVLIRIKDVAIGGYDQSIMSYPLGEGPRFSMVSMEFFIEEGFEDALNIDRDSFSALDPHFMRVQSFVHSMMRTIFPEIWTEEKKRNQKLREQKQQVSEQKFVGALSRTISRGHLREIRVREESSREEERPVRFHGPQGSVELAVAHPFLQPVLKRKKYRTIAQHISIAFERALLETTDEQRRKIFYQLLSGILSD